MDSDRITTPYIPPRNEPSILSTLANKFIDGLSESEDEAIAELDPIDWIQEHFYVDRPRDPVTAKMLPEGPIILAKYQEKIIREALSRTEDGRLKYSTVLWSEPKKSGKTAIGAAVAMFMAYNNPAGHVYCLANDGKQSADRIYNAISRCINLHNKHGGIFVGLKANIGRPILRLPQGSVIEALPCDAEGEAGSEPFLTVWSEMWGYAQAHKERMWTEMTIPPTLYGYAMRWVESYAGYEGESVVLWNLYIQGVKESYHHPDFPNLPVYVNEEANQITFWSEEPRQPWQTAAYYKAEAKLLTPNEFKRVHRNQWVTTTTALFEDMQWWDRCADKEIAKPLRPKSNIPVVVGVDAGYAGDCAAIYVVRRHPDDTWDEVNRRVVKVYSVAFKPEKGKPLNFSTTIERVLVRICKEWNVLEVAYDPYQLHKLCTDLRLQGIAAFKEFNQAGDRLKADRQLYDMIVHKWFVHDGDQVDREHIQNCAKKEEGAHMRFVKKVDGKPIDLAVAAAMATYRCLLLNM